jgi:hypothetical protein
MNASLHRQRLLINNCAAHELVSALETQAGYRRKAARAEHLKMVSAVITSGEDHTRRESDVHRTDYCLVHFNPEVLTRVHRPVIDFMRLI